jgi:hypothetical protein
VMLLYVLTLLYVVNATLILAPADIIVSFVFVEADCELNASMVRHEFLFPPPDGRFVASMKAMSQKVARRGNARFILVATSAVFAFFLWWAFHGVAIAEGNSEAERVFLLSRQPPAETQAEMSTRLATTAVPPATTAVPPPTTAVPPPTTAVPPPTTAVPAQPDFQANDLTHEFAPPPAYRMPRTPLPTEPLTFLETRLAAGDFSLREHGRQLYDLLVPHVRTPRIGDLIEEFEAPVELIELPEISNDVETKPATLDDFLPLQAVYNLMRNLASAAPAHWQSPPRGFVPSIGLTCMRHDFYLMLNYTMRLTDVPIGRMILVVNGRSAIVASLFVDIVHRTIPGFITGYPLRRNEGLPYAWNAAVLASMALPVPQELLKSNRPDGTIAPESVVREATDFVFITNVDLIHPTGAVANAAAEARRRIQDRNKLIDQYDNSNRTNTHPPQHLRIIRGLSFAAFYYLRTALPVYGLFDETLFPAYGEDIEMLARMRSVGDLAADVFLPYFHVESVVAKRDAHIKRMIGTMPRFDYLKEKWNLTQGAEAESSKYLFKHPFNNPRVPLSSWAVDPVQRACIRYQLKKKCLYNLTRAVDQLARF